MQIKSANNNDTLSAVWSWGAVTSRIVPDAGHAEVITDHRILWFYEV